MLTSELRANARRALTGKWGKGVLVTLCYLLITTIIELIPVVGQIASIIISLPLMYGIVASFIKLKRGEEVKFTGFIEEGFSKFGKVWGVFGHTLLKIIVPVIIVIVCLLLVTSSSVGAIIFGFNAEGDSAAGFSAITIVAIIGYIVSIIYCAVKGLLYMLTNYIIYDNPNMSSKEIVEESERLMNGNRWKYVWLELSFIGWMILSVFTFGIGLLVLVPYIEVAIICFYEALSGKVSNEEVEIIEENNNPISE